MDVTASEPRQTDNGTWFDTLVQLTEQEAEQLRNRSGGYGPAFYMPGTNRFPGRLHFESSAYTDPINVGLSPSAARAVGVISGTEAAEWVKSKLTAYLQ